MKKYIIILLLLFVPTISFSAPSITSVTGTLTNSSDITITGTGFGTNALDFEWTGDNIEAGTTGNAFAKTGWGNGVDYGDHLYATDQVHSGTKSLKSPVGYEGNSSPWGADIRYNGQAVGPGEVLYMTWWVRRNVTDVGQWKMLRISDTSNVVDHAYEQVWFNWNDGINGAQLFTRSATIDCTQGGGNCDRGAKFPTGEDTWYRLEMTMLTSSAGGTDGTYTQILYTPGSALQTDVEPNVQNWDEVGHQYDWYIFQNWAGNGIDGQTDWMDDIFIQSGTPSRVEMCAEGTWTSRTNCDIQISTVWNANGQSITFTLNQGGFAADATVYVYVVDSAGAVNANGYEITLGVDETSPTLSTAIVDETQLDLYFSEAVSQGAGYNDNQIDLDGLTAGDNIAVTYASGNGTNHWIYTIASSASFGDTINIDFSGTANSIEDGSGNDLAAIVSGSVTNETPNPTITIVRSVKYNSSGKSTGYNSSGKNIVIH